MAKDKKENPFLFCAEALMPSSAFRYLVFEGIPQDHFAGFFGVCQALWKKPPELFLLSEVGEESFDEAVKEQNPFIVIEALDVSAKELLPKLKLILKNYGSQRFVFLIAGDLAETDLPTYLGKYAYFSVGEEFKKAGVDFSKDDKKLLQHSKKLSPKYQFSDLVLGPKTRMKFVEALNFLKTRNGVEFEWGFRERHSRGHGVTIVLHGPSGTGKTMAAEVLANELGMPLYQIDLSSVMSKWVGETEKNLKSIFRAAEGVKGILLFDEGDAIFGNRVSVEGSQDRYANLEVNYLLQELEAFDGIIVLSTNHENNMDEAFLRRFTYAINIGLPSPAQRAEIWKQNLPKELPIDKNIDFAHLAQFSLTGGNIKSVIREAAARAWGQDRKTVSMLDFLWAIKRDLQKHGKPFERELVGEDFWRQVGPDWEYLYYKKPPEQTKLPMPAPQEVQ